MALGAPIGFSTRLTQNNGDAGLYQNQLNNGAGQIHIALMGDPTLRMHIVAPPQDLALSTNGPNPRLTWKQSAESVLGYHVYSSQFPNGPFVRLTSAPVSATDYTDVALSLSRNYMVRAVMLETSGSGTYYNLSQGTFLHPSTVAAPVGPLLGGTDGSDRVSHQAYAEKSSVPTTNAPPGTLRSSVL
jgi:hypothetical protein